MLNKTRHSVFGRSISVAYSVLFPKSTEKHGEISEVALERSSVFFLFHMTKPVSHINGNGKQLQSYYVFRHEISTSDNWTIFYGGLNISKGKETLGKITISSHDSLLFMPPPSSHSYSSRQS